MQCIADFFAYLIKGTKKMLVGTILRRCVFFIRKDQYKDIANEAERRGEKKSKVLRRLIDESKGKL